MDNYNIYATKDNNWTFSDEVQEVSRWMIVRKKMVFDPDPPITLSPWPVERDLDGELVDKDHIEAITKAREEYKKGEVTSEVDLFALLNQDFNIKTPPVKEYSLKVKVEKIEPAKSKIVE